VAKRSDFAAGYPLHISDECCSVVGPLRPGIDVTALTRAHAMAAKVDGEGAHAVACHSFGKSGIAARVLTQAMHYGKGNVGAGLRPGAIGEFCPVGRLD
jgi:hypothetical protein